MNYSGSSEEYYECIEMVGGKPLQSSSFITGTGGRQKMIRGGIEPVMNESLDIKDSLRANDLDRDRITSYLNKVNSQGFIDSETLNNRIDAAMKSQTVKELEALIKDLPNPGTGQDRESDLVKFYREESVDYSKKMKIFKDRLVGMGVWNAFSSFAMVGIGALVITDGVAAEGALIVSLASIMFIVGFIIWGSHVD